MTKHTHRQYSGLCLSAIFLVVCAPFCTAGTQQEITFYVSPKGNDAWTGRIADPNSQASDGPFATLEKARDAIRAAKRAAGQPIKATVFVRGGTYYLSRPFQLGVEDSGTSESPVRYRAFQGERPVLVGGRVIRGFKPYRDKILSARLSEQGWQRPDFRQLFYRSRRQFLARRPNFDPQNPYGGGFSYVEDVAEKGSKRKFKYAPGAISRWVRPQEAEVFIFPRYNWNNNIVPIATIDETNRVIALQRDVSYDIQKSDRYYIQNVFEELDAPGEWFLDRATATLYFWPPDDGGTGILPVDVHGQDAHATQSEVAAPVLGTVVEIGGAGGDASPAHISFEGFTIECCDGTGVFIRNANYCVVAGCTVRNCGGAGIAIDGGKGSGAFGNDVYDVGRSGITVSGGDRRMLAPAGNFATNNYVHHIGVFEKQIAGISVRGVGNILSHNLIHDCPRWGLGFGGNDHIIEFNHVRHVNLETADTGGIYICARDWTQCGTILRYNIFHDILGYGREKGKWVSPHYAWGIYIDDWSSGIKIFGNITYRTPYGGVDIHGGRDNEVENNIFIEGAQHQVMYQAIEATHSSVPNMFQTLKNMNYTKYPELLNMQNHTKMANNRFFRNVIYFSKPDSILYRLMGYDFDTCKSDYNTIYHFGQPLLVTLKDVPKEKQWDKWREMGFDQHSVVADPLFVDPKKDDYRLRPESSAFKLGFKPIPVEKIGPFADPRRASWPIVEAEGAREKPLVSEK